MHHHELMEINLKACTDFIMVSWILGDNGPSWYSPIDCNLVTTCKTDKITTEVIRRPSDGKVNLFLGDSKSGKKMNSSIVNAYLSLYDKPPFYGGR